MLKLIDYKPVAPHLENFIVSLPGIPNHPVGLSHQSNILFTNPNNVHSVIPTLTASTLLAELGLIPSVDTSTNTTTTTATTTTTDAVTSTATPSSTSINSTSISTATSITIDLPTRVLALYNMITPSEINNDDEWNEIYTEINDEGMKYGTLLKVIIPRNKRDEHDIGTDIAPRTTQGIGTIFLIYETIDMATNAYKILNGRLFNGQRIRVVYYDEHKLNANIFV